MHGNTDTYKDRYLKYSGVIVHMTKSSCKRTFTGCWSCRFKKRRCDERRPKCSLCEKYLLDCSYDIRLVWKNDNVFYRHTEKTSSTSSLDAKFDTPSERPVNSKFTISERRFKVYRNNAVKSVYGNLAKDCYDQKSIDKRLNELLARLENRLLSQQENRLGHEAIVEGPFAVFEWKPRTLEPKGFDVRRHINNNVLLYCTKDLILSRRNYFIYFLQYINKNLDLRDFTRLAAVVQRKYTLPDLLSEHQEPTWQRVALTVHLMVSNYEPGNAKYLEDWITRQESLEYTLYPVISYVARTTESLATLYHCYSLLNCKNSNIEETRPAQLVILTVELNLLTIEKIIKHWIDVVLDQICKYQDTSHSCSEFLYWESQLRLNKRFYRYLTQDEK